MWKRYRTIAISAAMGIAALVALWVLMLGGSPAVAGRLNTCPTDLFISEYIEGSSYNKAIEIYNGTGADIIFTGQYTLALYSNGSPSVSQDVALNGSIAKGDVFVIAHGSAGQDIQDEADQTSNSVINFNGNDAVALSKNGAIIDVIGQIGTDPGSEWGSGDTTTQDHTLVRNTSVTSGDSNGGDVFDPADEWDGYAQDTFDYLGSHAMDPCVATFLISKLAPDKAKPDEVFTYTLTVQNNTGVTPTTTTITDVVPSGATFVTASHGGTESDGIVTWRVSDLADGATITREFQVAATGGHSDVIENADYGVNGGSDWLTTTSGTTVTTQIVDCSSIYGIQYPGDDSLCEGEAVAVEGIVHAVYGSGFALAEDTGAWHGVYVYDSGVPMPEIGDSIRITGTVAEYYDLTELTSVTYTVMSTGTTPYAASVISTTGAASGEAYEGVLVEVHDVLVTNEDLGYGEWEIDDGSGAARVHDMGSYTYSPTYGDALDLVRGMLNYNHGNFKIEPRDDDDIVQATGAGLLVSKQAPSFVPPGEVFTYTLTVENQTAQLLNDLTISDTLPLSLAYASSNPLGSWDDATHTITWTDASLAHDNALTFTIAVTAPTAMTTVANTDYAARASDWPTRATGSAAETLIRDCNSVYGVQYTADAGGGTYPSPCEGETVTVQGTVYAVYGSNYFIADAAGPWHGVYIHSGGQVNVGDEVEITGKVSEYYGVTEIDFPSVKILSSGNTPHGPSIVTADHIPFDDADASEGYEGVFVETHDITVTAEADSHGIWTFTDASGGEGKVDDWGYHAEPSVGGAYAVLRGAVAYDYGEYKVIPRDADDVAQAAMIDLEKNAVTTVAPNSLLTYTLTVLNNTGLALADVTITDVVPANTSFAYALDGGAESDGVVSWTVQTLEMGSVADARLVVTATDGTGAVIINDDYAATAANFATPTLGVPIGTIVTTEALRIHDIQGAGHLSPLKGRQVDGIYGIVTVKRSNGFYMQDPDPDGDIATSEAIFVAYTGSSPPVNVGDGVLVSGIVGEFRHESEHLSMTRIEEPTVIVSSTGNGLPEATVIGDGGRVPPDRVIDDDATGDVETSGSFDPATDGIDFYESLEAMLVQVNDAIAVGPTSYGVIPVVGDRGTNAGLLTPRGGIVARPDDFNPERVLVDGTIYYTKTPSVDVGMAFAGPITGVIDYDDYNGNFNLFNVDQLPATTGGVISETATAPTTNQLRVASFNVYNLDPEDSADRFAAMAGQIVDNLQAPDIIGVQEIQDSSGTTDDGTVDAAETYTTLIEAIEAAGGPTYEFRDIAPLDGMDGGVPGGNIRVGFLFRTDRGLSFVDRGVATATTEVSVTMGASGAELTYSPGRVDPNNAAFDESRKSLAGEFTFSGHRLFVVVNHFKSKGGDDPLFGHAQPPIRYTDEKRKNQAQAINDFVDTVLALEPNASVIVLGDLNDFQFSEAVSDTLAPDALTNLASTLPITRQYTYNYNGNSEALDHILVSDYLFGNRVDFDIVHVNSEFAYSGSRASDHDPVVATFNLPCRLYLPLVMRGG